ncbi:MAG TPA: SUMF1/EgtB/PvdO family nonheme iron enzyme [Byssovorax sp.]|jgi:predicted small lipoprotein YifL
MRRAFAAVAVVAFACAAIAACGHAAPPDAPDAAAAATATATTAATSPAAALDAGDPDAGDLDAGDAGDVDAGDAGDALPGATAGCPAGMVLVEGEYCPSVDQRCLEHDKEYERDEAKKAKKKASGEDSEASTVSERCLRYEEPSRCLSKQRVHMRFCVDRYEWPNEKGELPALLLSWGDAKKLCEGEGKRLCGESEFNFACEGEAMLPYTYGYARDATKCNIDRPYRKREHKLLKYARCMKSEACKKELARLDQRLPAGSLPACVSPFGVYDLNGNINEWVVRPKQKYPNRSGLKGGWWGPVRGRCRPTVGFHKEDDYGYEEGFRCCKDAE